AGIAPPGPAPKRAPGPVPITLTAAPAAVRCPACGSADAVRTAAFGATACQDLYRCQACAEPFAHVKEI
ncbi:MAG: 1,2-phenylacetyl-CoA epoxidase subunit PaaD, partial [Streptosporangiaceae bacterium]